MPKCDRMLSRSLFSASRGRSRSSTFLCREYHSAQQGCDISDLHSIEGTCEKRMCGHSSTEPAGAYFPRETKPTFSSHTSKLCKTCRASCEDARIYIIEMRRHAGEGVRRINMSLIHPRHGSGLRLSATVVFHPHSDRHEIRGCHRGMGSKRGKFGWRAS